MATGTFDMAKALNDTVTGVSAPGAGSPGAAGAAGLVAAPGAAAGAPAEGGAAAGAGAQALPSHPPSSKRTHRARIVGPPSRVAAERWSSRATRVIPTRRAGGAVGATGCRPRRRARQVYDGLVLAVRVAERVRPSHSEHRPTRWAYVAAGVRAFKPNSASAFRYRI